ncbi:hypothetical protein HS125_17905 [bacterium]|nr:hypothetical protein [bacterium]
MILRLSVVLILLLPFSAGAQPTPAGATEETPAGLWARCRPTLLPYNYTIVKDEIVPSDTVVGMKLRRIEVKFYSQELEGRKWGHPCVIFAPAERRLYARGARRGRVVIVGQRSWDGLATGPWRDAFLGNYGEPIAARTGYPTMICPVPGEYDGEDGREISIGFLSAYYQKTGQLYDHPLFRIGVPYLLALDVMADVLRLPRQDIRAVVGGHSKRATPIPAMAAADPRIVGIVYMGNESAWSRHHLESKERVLYPPYCRKWSNAKTLYIGGTNEDGYAMYRINAIQASMGNSWTIEMVPNYRHASQSEKHPLDWMMWIAHVFDGRPITTIRDLSYERKGADFLWGGRKYGAGTLFRCRIDSPNKLIMVKVWYVYNDDPPYWRDLVWYPEFMVRQPDGSWAGYVTGKLPDAWMVEVKDTAQGFPGYVTSLPQDLTGLPVETRRSRGSRSRHWSPE